MGTLQRGACADRWPCAKFYRLPRLRRRPGLAAAPAWATRRVSASCCRCGGKHCKPAGGCQQEPPTLLAAAPCVHGSERNRWRWPAGRLQVGGLCSSGTRRALSRSEADTTCRRIPSLRRTIKIRCISEGNVLRRLSRSDAASLELRAPVGPTRCAAAGRAVRCQDRRLLAWSCAPQWAQKAIYGCTVHRLYGAAAAPQRLLVLNMQAKSQPLSTGPPRSPPLPPPATAEFAALSSPTCWRAGARPGPGFKLGVSELGPGPSSRARQVVCPGTAPSVPGQVAWIISLRRRPCDGRRAQRSKAQNWSRPGPTARARACNQVLRV